MATKGMEDQNKLDLLVFGYACKLFRDDERAHMMDTGSHLIPWMGDEALKIDRYDGRGALFDLTSHEPKSEAACKLNDEEEAIEQLCDKERYRSLYMNEEEQLFYQHEMAKRSHQKQQQYGDVAYNYDVPNYPDVPNYQDDLVHGKPFVPPPELKVPPDMKLPETQKHNAILEKTALFLAQQGSQMEILMKVKQQENKYFNFLSHNDELHAYYKHLKELIKSGVYVPKEQDFEDEITNQDQRAAHPVKKAAPPVPRPVQEVKPKPPPPENITPPPYLQQIISLMIKYVLKNGSRFEDVIIKRNDCRFSFLNPNNPYHTYYKEEFTKRQLAKQKVESANPENAKLLKRKAVPVSFSIKKPKESEGLEVLSVLPLEESSDDDDKDNSPPARKPDCEPDAVTNTLEKRLRKSDILKDHKGKKKDAYLQNERKLKVAQFLKDLKKKGT